jgi:phosphoglycerol transferase MdoB-like AlkP superfamily enzyme
MGKKAIGVYSFILILLFGFITAGELGIYPEWKAKLSAKALLYLRRPDEVATSIPSRVFINLLGIAVLITFAGWYFFRRLVLRYFKRQNIKLKYAVPGFLILLGLLFTGIRGGFGPIPISPSAAYFSNKNFLNHAAVNSGFNLAISILESNKFRFENPFKWHRQDEAERMVEPLLPENTPDSTHVVLNNSRPNIVLILLESWSADLIASLGGEPGITPEFAELEEGGILFTDFYSTGSRSQQAIAAIISGFPATPYTTITENAGKYSQLPSLVKLLSSEGYHTSFYFGGKLTYGNIKAFLYHNEFDRIIEQDDFDPSIPAGRLGIHDEHLFERHLDDFEEITQPFFTIVFTLSSHSPYDQPMEKVLDWGGNENEFINSAYYTDHHLGKYMERAKSQEWYPNTLFIMVADHSHNTYRNWPLTSFEYHRVPLFLYGDVIKQDDRGRRMDIISCNTDITATLLNQLGMDSSPFIWSKDLFNPNTYGYAYFELHYGFGWKTREGQFVYSWDWDHYYQKDFAENMDRARQDEFIREGRAYLQVIFQAFLNL